MAGESEVVISADGKTSVTIWVTKLDHNIDKPLVNIPLPRQKSSMDADTAWGSYLVDIGRIKELITLQGTLIDETTESALTKKNNLFSIVGYKRAITITWGTGSNAQTRTGNISKVMTTETPGIVGEQQSGYYSEKNFAVQLSLMVGTDK